MSRGNDSRCLPINTSPSEIYEQSESRTKIIRENHDRSDLNVNFLTFASLLLTERNYLKIKDSRFENANFLEINNTAVVTII